MSDESAPRKPNQIRLMRERYEYHAEEPAVLMELYLPKKPQFQGILYDTLTNGFNYEFLKSYFSDPDTWNGIMEFFRQNYPNYTKLTADLVEQMDWMLGGYSLYEVDGVFSGEYQREPIAERTQVVRLIFRPDFDGIQALHPDVDRSDLLNACNSYFEDINLPSIKIIQDYKDEKNGTIRKMVNDWLKALILLVYGYIIKSISDKIELMVETEDEIWLVSFKNSIVNRIISHGGLYGVTKRHIRYLSAGISETYYKQEIVVKNGQEIRIDYGDIKNFFGEEERDAELVDMKKPMVDDRMMLDLSSISVKQGESVSIELEKNVKLTDIYAAIKCNYVLLKTDIGLMYWFNNDEDGDFRLEANVIEDGGALYGKIVDSNNNKRLRRRLAAEQLAN